MIKNILIFSFLFKVIFGQDLTAYEVMDRVYSIPKPKTSIMEIRLEITRKKGIKKKQRLGSLQGMRNIMKKENTDLSLWPDSINQMWLKEQDY